MTDDVPLAPMWPGARSIRERRLWRVGAYVIEGDELCYTWVLGRRSLAQLERLPHALTAGDALPACLRFAPDCDALLTWLDENVPAQAHLFGVE
jgi:hypothetical protein